MNDRPNEKDFFYLKWLLKIKNLQVTENIAKQFFKFEWWWIINLNDEKKRQEFDGQVKLKVTSWSTWLLFSLLVFVLPRWIFLLFREAFKSLKSFQLSSFAWPSRVTLKLKVTSTWLLLSPLVFVLLQWFFCFVRLLDHWIHSNYRCLHDLHAWPWNWRSRHVLRDFSYLCLYMSYRNAFLFVS